VLHEFLSEDVRFETTEMICFVDLFN